MGRKIKRNICPCGKKCKQKRNIYCSYSCRNKYRKVTFSDKRNEKVSKSRLGKLNCMWKGNKVGYNALHNWVRRNKVRINLCEKCKKNKSYDLANISGNYLRDINDYEWLCRSCHMKDDGRIYKFWKNRHK
jgi:hypothetical protein